MKRISLLLLVVIGIQAADPNTPWPSSGPVGIGTTTPLAIQPSAILALNKTSGHNYLAISTELTSQSAVSFCDNTWGQDSVIYRPQGSRDLRIYTSTVGDVMSFMQNGNVGIGTTTPTSKLDVRGGIRASSNIIAGSGFSNNGFTGTNSGNARNHFDQSTAGSTTPLTGGWISAAFGDTSGSRVVIGQGESVAIIAGHTGDLVTWADLYISGSPLNQGTGVTYIRGRAPTTVPIDTVAIGGGRVMVGGILSAKEIKVTTTGADYVFDDTYRLRPLTEVEQFIKDNRHLPEIPSAKVMQQDGMGVSEIVTKQLAKIEELTLYAIQAERAREAQANRLATLEHQVATMAAANAQLMEQLQLVLKNHQRK